MANFNEIQYGNFGKCLKIDNGTVEAVVTLDLGPRIIRYGLIGGENIMFEDTDRAINQKDNAHLFEQYGDNGYWYIYGGHRLWTSPEALPRSYYPDNAPVAYKIDGNTATFAPAPQIHNQIAMEISITMGEKEMEVSHKIINTGAWEVEFAAWALTVMKLGGLEVVPYNDSDPNSLLNNRLIAVWPYTNMSDKRVNWGTKFATVTATDDKSTAFKFGLNNEKGYSIYFVDGNAFVKRYNFIKDATYPDGGMCFETYTNGTFIEMESVSPLMKVAPNKSITHTEYWSIAKGIAAPTNEDEIEKIIKGIDVI